MFGIQLSESETTIVNSYPNVKQTNQKKSQLLFNFFVKQVIKLGPPIEILRKF